MHKSKLIKTCEYSEICRLHSRDGLNPREISEIYNVNNNTIIRILKSCDCYKPSKKLIAHNKSDVRFFSNEIISLYQNGMSSVNIANIYSCSHKTILEVLYDNNIKVRDSSESRRVLSLNVDMFEKINTSEKAYWLGFLFADGGVSGNSTAIALHKKDILHLHKFREFMGYGGKITRYSNYCRLGITNKKMTNDLKSLGCIERKSLVLTYPNIPKKYNRDFIRGYFDGDGSISRSVRKEGHIRYSVSFLGTSEFLSEILNMFEEIGVDRHKLYRKKGRTNNNWYFNYGAVDDVKKILDFLYGDCDVYLDRKKERYHRFLKEKIEGCDN